MSSVGNTIGYAGYVWDPALGGAASGQFLARHRWYSPNLGRWTSRDPIGYADGMNLYGYVGGMPLMLVDPMGLYEWGAFWRGAKQGAKQFARGALGLGSGADPCDTTLSVSYRLGQGVGAAWSLVGAGKVVKAAGKALLKKAGAKVAAKTAGKSAVRGGATAVRTGQAGESAVKGAHAIGTKAPIQIAGRTRIPDGLTGTVLSEVKNVKSLSYTQQLRDYATYASQNGLQFDLYVRRTTYLTKPLIEQITRGRINLRYIP